MLRVTEVSSDGVLFLCNGISFSRTAAIGEENKVLFWDVLAIANLWDVVMAMWTEFGEKG